MANKTKPRYGITLTKTKRDTDTSILLELEGKPHVYYKCNSPIPERQLIKHFGSRDMLQRVINSGLINAGSSYGVYNVPPTKVEVFEYPQNPKQLEVITHSTATDPITIIDTMWNER